MGKHSLYKQNEYVTVVRTRKQPYVLRVEEEFDGNVYGVEQNSTSGIAFQDTHHGGRVVKAEQVFRP
jgi:hypothetical protein